MPEFQPGEIVTLVATPVPPGPKGMAYSDGPPIGSHGRVVTDGIAGGHPAVWVVWEQWDRTYNSRTYMRSGMPMHPDCIIPAMRLDFTDRESVERWLEL